MAQVSIGCAASWVLEILQEMPSYNNSCTGGLELAIAGITDWRATITAPFAGEGTDPGTGGLFPGNRQLFNFYEVNDGTPTATEGWTGNGIVADLEISGDVAAGEVVMGTWTIEGDGVMTRPSGTSGTTLISAKNGYVGWDTAS